MLCAIKRVRKFHLKERKKEALFREVRQCIPGANPSRARPPEHREDLPVLPQGHGLL
ncbi:unnamed protein product, partial [Ectocarpus sp. 12 AP-2014]